MMHPMQIDRPEWVLTRECPCGVCDGAYVSLLSCVSCGHLFARCEETQDLFPDPHWIMPEFVIEDAGPCPGCHGGLRLEPASGEVIQAAGFRHRIDYR